MKLNPEQVEAVEAVAGWREIEREEIRRVREELFSASSGARAMVSRHIQHALEIGVPKAHLKRALGNKNPDALEPYLPAKH